MTRFAFMRPGCYSQWGGDLKAILDLQEGLLSLGHESFITSDLMAALDSDQIFFIGTLIDQSPQLHAMKLLNRSYGCIPFHEDQLLYSGASFGLPYYIAGALHNRIEEGVEFSLENLYQRPHLIFYYDRMRPVQALQNYEFLKHASSIIVSSPTEQKTILRDVPEAKSHVVFWGAGHARGALETPTEDFLRFTGLKSREYILQVGRMSARKNQLATLLATKDLNIPLVFIAMDRCNPTYEEIFFAAALKWRKAPVFLISQHLSAKDSQGPIRVIPTRDGGVLSKHLILSAFNHAGLHLHPAFYELPGYTYFESARFGVPTIASKWSSLKDYFSEENGWDDRIEYALPYDLSALNHLVQKKFGQTYPKLPLHPIYQRTAIDIARDFVTSL